MTALRRPSTRRRTGQPPSPAIRRARAERALRQISPEIPPPSPPTTGPEPTVAGRFRGAEERELAAALYAQEEEGARIEREREQAEALRVEDERVRLERQRIERLLGEETERVRALDLRQRETERTFEEVERQREEALIEDEVAREREAKRAAEEKERLLKREEKLRRREEREASERADAARAEAERIRERELNEALAEEARVALASDLERERRQHEDTIRRLEETQERLRRAQHESDEARRELEAAARRREERAERFRLEAEAAAAEEELRATREIEELVQTRLREAERGAASPFALSFGAIGLPSPIPAEEREAAFPVEELAARAAPTVAGGGEEEEEALLPLPAFVSWEPLPGGVPSAAPYFVTVERPPSPPPPEGPLGFGQVLPVQPPEAVPAGFVPSTYGPPPEYVPAGAAAVPFAAPYGFAPLPTPYALAPPSTPAYLIAAPSPAVYAGAPGVRPRRARRGAARGRGRGRVIARGEEEAEELEARPAEEGPPAAAVPPPRRRRGRPPRREYGPALPRGTEELAEIFTRVSRRQPPERELLPELSFAEWAQQGAADPGRTVRTPFGVAGVGTPAASAELEALARSAHSRMADGLGKHVELCYLYAWMDWTASDLGTLALRLNPQAVAALTPTAEEDPAAFSVLRYLAPFGEESQFGPALTLGQLRRWAYEDVGAYTAYCDTVRPPDPLCGRLLPLSYVDETTGQPSYLKQAMPWPVLTAGRGPVRRSGLPVPAHLSAEAPEGSGARPVMTDVARLLPLPQLTQLLGVPFALGETALEFIYHNESALRGEVFRRKLNAWIDRELRARLPCPEMPRAFAFSALFHTDLYLMSANLPGDPIQAVYLLARVAPFQVGTTRTGFHPPV